VDPNSMVHGFLRARNGTVTTLDVPGAIHTYPVSISSSSAIAGFYVDAAHKGHGFLRTP